MLNAGSRTNTVVCTKSSDKCLAEVDLGGAVFASSACFCIMLVRILSIMTFGLGIMSILRTVTQESNLIDCEILLL